MPVFDKDSVEGRPARLSSVLKSAFACAHELAGSGRFAVRRKIGDSGLHVRGIGRNTPAKVDADLDLVGAFIIGTGMVDFDGGTLARITFRIGSLRIGLL